MYHNGKYSAEEEFCKFDPRTPTRRMSLIMAALQTGSSDETIGNGNGPKLARLCKM
jgi:hypothetical protein